MDSNCFEINSKNDLSDKLILCACPFSPNSGTIVTNWFDALNKFKNSCTDYKYDGAIPITAKDQIILDVGGEQVTLDPDQIKDVAQQAVQDAQDANDRQQEQENGNRMADTIDQVEKLANDATKTEFFKEQLLQKEQALKQQEDLKKLDSAIQKQQEKLKCIEMM